MKLPPSVLRALDAVDEVLRGGGGDALILASVLRSATRGPDQGQSDRDNLKMKTTAALRKLAFPWGGGNFGGIISDGDEAVGVLSGVSYAAVQRVHGEHFASNLRQSAEKFGIILKP